MSKVLNNYVRVQYAKYIDKYNIKPCFEYKAPNWRISVKYIAIKYFSPKFM